MISIDLNLVWTIINLVVLYLLLKHFLIGPVMNVMEQRRQMKQRAKQRDCGTEKETYQTSERVQGGR